MNVSHLCYQNDCSCDNGSVVGHDKPFWHYLHKFLSFILINFFLLFEDGKFTIKESFCLWYLEKR